MGTKQTEAKETTQTADKPSRTTLMQMQPVREASIYTRLAQQYGSVVRK